MVFDLPKIKERINELEKETSKSDFWSDQNKAKKINSELSLLNERLSSFSSLDEELNNCKTGLMLLKEEDDKSFHEELENNIFSLQLDCKNFERELYLNGPYDRLNAIIDFHPGAGGTEAHDWASMLLRMYTKFAESHRYECNILDIQMGEEAGISSATLIIKGKDAYGKLKSELGVHRLVRISPFDATHSRHTSFASVNVMPEIDSSINIDIKPTDITIETYRSSGAGGQNVNKTESAVRIIHHPSGIVVTCQVERSQMQNKEMAMNLLKARLFQKMEKERLEKLAKINGIKKNIEWGSQIRSYVFQPYTLVKDHRTDYSETDVQSVMDGNLDGFIDEYLKWNFMNNKEEEDN